MNSAEKNTRKKIGISIIDVLVIITFIACIAGTFIHYKVYEKNNAVSTDDTCLVSILFEGVGAELADRYSVGDKIYYNGVGLIGTVAEVSASDSVVYYKNSRNELVAGNDNSIKDVTVIVEAIGEVSTDGFRLNGTDYIAAGMKIDAYTPKISGKGLIFDVKKQAD